jgi:hypothetical protein
LEDVYYAPIFSVFHTYSLQALMDRRSGRGGAASIIDKSGISGHTWLLKELQDRAKQPWHDHIFDFLKMKVSLFVCIQ